MKRMLHLTVLVLTILSLLGASRPVSAAPLRDPAVMSLVDLGAASEIVLRGPYDTADIQFSLPPTWTLQEGAELDLVISAYYASTDGGLPSPTQSNNFLGALLDVSFNGKLQQSVPLNIGNNLIYRVPIEASALKSTRRDGSLDIGFFLNAAIDCNNLMHHTTVVIKGTSQAQFPYAQTALHYDLRRLPWPLYQTGLKIPEPAVVVIPGTASASNLQSGLIAMAALGRMSHSKLPVTMVTADELTAEARSQSNLIFVGSAAGFPALEGVSLPAPIAASQFSAEEMKADDGIVEMATSPWNPAKSLLLIGGNTETGILKAAQAFSTGSLQTGMAPAYSVVAEVKPVSGGEAEGALPSPDISLADMGKTAETITGMGTNWFSYTFTVPPGQVATDDPSLNLVYSNSSLVDPTRSGAVVYLNGNTVGSLAFSDTDSNKVTSRINLPLSSIHPGTNTVDIAATLIPRDICSMFSFNGLWMSVFPESVLHLPLTAATPQGIALQDLSTYPFPFANDPSLSTTTFVVPQSDHNAWAAAGLIAYNMGAGATGAILAPSAAYDGQISASQKAGDLILVGQPKDLGVIGTLKSSLPAYFENGSNVAVLPAQQVTYRISPNKDLGYLELFESPWQSERAVLAVFGTSGNGLASSAAALTTSGTRQNLAGNFATVDGEQVTVVDTRSGLGTGRLPSALGPVVTPELTPALAAPSVQPAAVAYSRLPILLALIVVVLLATGVLVAALVVQRRKLKNPR